MYKQMSDKDKAELNEIIIELLTESDGDKDKTFHTIAAQTGDRRNAA